MYTYITNEYCELPPTHPPACLCNGPEVEKQVINFEGLMQDSVCVTMRVCIQVLIKCGMSLWYMYSCIANEYWNLPPAPMPVQWVRRQERGNQLGVALANITDVQGCCFSFGIFRILVFWPSVFVEQLSNDSVAQEIGILAKWTKNECRYEQKTRSPVT